ncbi:MAG: hypothetical protein MN733_15400 [Nitrososphaera sp.]|nr:hypothetical protein [Nitrososphaera sp.]
MIDPDIVTARELRAELNAVLRRIPAAYSLIQAVNGKPRLKNDRQRRPDPTIQRGQLGWGVTVLRDDQATDRMKRQYQDATRKYCPEHYLA